MPIILGRPFLATSNAIINCRNGIMQLTFSNMTMELNIFHLKRKHVHPEEEIPEEVCLIDKPLRDLILAYNPSSSPETLPHQLWNHGQNQRRPQLTILDPPEIQQHPPTNAQEPHSPMPSTPTLVTRSSPQAPTT